MDRDHRIPPALTVGLVLVVLAVGAASYYAGRFRRSPNPTPVENVDLPPPAASAPDVAQMIGTPADVPPTVTPSVSIVVEKGARSSRPVERSSQIVVPVPPAAPTVLPASAPIAPVRYPTAARRIVVEANPTPTPTPPETQLRPPPPPAPADIPPPPAPFDTPELPPPEETPEFEPEPEPTPGPGFGSAGDR